MNKTQLTDLANNPAFISGIYNYCDRWCERCAFTSRCFLYATEQADPDANDPELRDLTNEKFWQKLQNIFADTARIISEWAAETGIDLDSVDVTEEMAEHKREMEAAEQDELSKMARHYAMTVQNWFRDQFVTDEDVHDDAMNGSEPVSENVTARDAAEIIQWYQFFIAVKLTRALSRPASIDESSDDEDVLTADFLPAEETDELVDYDAVISRAHRIDSNGSAKVALVAIDRSTAAWGALQLSLPDKAHTINQMLVELDRLRRLTEKRFPQARDFIRPGLDEVLSEFVS
ncbi:MAG TPA: hypothetical protein DC054_15885 [Blastocatellia bacterium]|nr:hypothetical protein [Blastocatellia bacterium]